jgi:hypothetical protein
MWCGKKIVLSCTRFVVVAVVVDVDVVFDVVLDVVVDDVVVVVNQYPL